jgi:hypothetical protein
MTERKLPEDGGGTSGPAIDWDSLPPELAQACALVNAALVAGSVRVEVDLGAGASTIVPALSAEPPAELA